ncbi:hypothetical protein ACWGBU_40805 [Streptomyces vinaceus]
MRLQQKLAALTSIMGKKMLRAAAVLAATSIVIIAAPVAAHAASGEFHYATSDGVAHSLANPGNDQCYTVTVDGWADGKTRNWTDRTAVLFAQPYCGGAASASLSANSNGQQQFKSVKFQD